MTKVKPQAGEPQVWGFERMGWEMGFTMVFQQHFYNGFQNSTGGYLWILGCVFSTKSKIVIWWLDHPSSWDLTGEPYFGHAQTNGYGCYRSQTTISTFCNVCSTDDQLLKGLFRRLCVELVLRHVFEKRRYVVGQLVFLIGFGPERSALWSGF